MTFRAIPLYFEFEAKDPIRFPPGKAGNTFRGALGPLLPESLFAPRGDTRGPSGFEDRPRPFVLRAAALDGRSFEPGERFTLDVNLLDLDPAIPALFTNAFERLSIEGIGPSRGRIQLVQTKQKDPISIPIAHCGAANPGRSRLSGGSTPTPQAVALQLQFLTPTELKFEGATLREPRFDVLFARIRDRVAWFCGAPHLDYRALGNRARAITTTALRIEQTQIERRSSRTGQRHGIGGFTGEADYAGDLAEFLPWLKAAEWTGVGRHTVWGNGALLVRILAGVPDDHVAVQPDPGGSRDAVLVDSKTRK